MKTCHVFCYDHMDPVWKRGWKRHARFKGQVIRSYSELESMQIDRWLKAIANSDTVYSVEQSLSVRNYLERNPDQLAKVRTLVEQDKLELLGGGETIIDYNMVNGESIVRNHVNSIRYYMNLFGVRPDMACCTDTFGLSCQLPQIFRQLGYECITHHDRIFRTGAKYWKGLDGSMVMIARPLEPTRLLPGGEYVARRPAACCDGEGCNACRESGLEIEQTSPLFAVDHEDIWKLLVEEPNKDRFCIASEEGLVDPAWIAGMKDHAAKRGIDLRFTRFDRFVEGQEALALARLRDNVAPGLLPFASPASPGGRASSRAVPVECADAGELSAKPTVIGDEDLHPGVESEPVCTGCYVSRIEFKQVNRRLEESLRTAETLSALAVVKHGCIYPGLKLERLWNTMALLQFHDAITGSHTDFCAEELMEHARTVSFEAKNVIENAMQALVSDIDGSGCSSVSIVGNQSVDGRTTAPAVAVERRRVRVSRPGAGQERNLVVFNPLGHRVDHALVDVSFNLESGQEDLDWEISDDSGHILPVIENAVYPTEYRPRRRLQVLADVLSPVGFKKLRLKPCPEKVSAMEPIPVKDGIENEFYRISFDADGCSGIFDKRLGKQTMKNAGSPAVEMDYGSLWETLAQPAFFKDLYRISDMEITATRMSWGSEATVKGSLRSASHNWNYDDQGLHSVEWVQRFRLVNGCDSIFLSYDVDWDVENTRLVLQFPLTFEPPDDEAWYEVPFGVLKRKSYAPEYGRHTAADGSWPTLNFVGCQNTDEDYSVFLFNRGIPCARVRRGVISSVPLRSPTIPLYAYDFDGALEKGRHRFEYMIRSGSGGIRENRAVQHGMAFNARFSVAFGEASGNIDSSFVENEADNVILSAVKLSENDDLVIRCYEAYGDEAVDRLTGVDQLHLFETDLLENEQRAVDEIRYRPHEIKTFLLRKKNGKT